MATTLATVEAREVLRCEHCSLVQFRTMNSLCRKCHKSLEIEEPEVAAPHFVPQTSEPAAEEKGLLGSRFFAGHPTVPEGSVVADLNLDMFMPIFAFKKLHVQGLEQSTLADQARAVGSEHHIEIAGDPEPDRNSFIRTDQYSFVQAGVPALAMKFGWTPGSPEYKAWREWLAERYHSTDDDLTQPVDLAAAAQFNRFFADLARAVANEAATPHYLDSSFFKRFEPHP